MLLKAESSKFVASIRWMLCRQPAVLRCASMHLLGAAAEEHLRAAVQVQHANARHGEDHF